MHFGLDGYLRNISKSNLGKLVSVTQSIQSNSNKHGIFHKSFFSKWHLEYYNKFPTLITKKSYYLLSIIYLNWKVLLLELPLRCKEHQTKIPSKSSTYNWKCHIISSLTNNVFAKYLEWSKNPNKHIDNQMGTSNL
jgi:hypothetical protein